jgi:hypothetical protein
MSERTQRTDFQATSDPALLASADRGESHLLTYRQLYELWERQHWATQDLDFTQDRIDWHERITEDASSGCTGCRRSSSASSGWRPSSGR